MPYLARVTKIRQLIVTHKSNDLVLLDKLGVLLLKHVQSTSDNALVAELADLESVNEVVHSDSSEYESDTVVEASTSQSRRPLDEESESSGSDEQSCGSTSETSSPSSEANQDTESSESDEQPCCSTSKRGLECEGASSRSKRIRKYVNYKE